MTRHASACRRPRVPDGLSGRRASDRDLASLIAFLMSRVPAHHDVQPGNVGLDWRSARPHRVTAVPVPGDRPDRHVATQSSCPLQGDIDDGELASRVIAPAGHAATQCRITGHRVRGVAGRPRLVPLLGNGAGAHDPKICWGCRTTGRRPTGRHRHCSGTEPLADGSTRHDRDRTPEMTENERPPGQN